MIKTSERPIQFATMLDDTTLRNVSKIEENHKFFLFESKKGHNDDYNNEYIEDSRERNSGCNLFSSFSVFYLLVSI
jgi:hypothetical protein